MNKTTGPKLGTRKRDHRPRFDTTVCPNPEACRRLFHPELFDGDNCECCGQDIGEERENPVAEPMKYHGPGWTYDTDEVAFLLWAPNAKRSYWQAAWDMDAGMRGNCQRGATAAEALDLALRTCPDADAVQNARRALLAAAEQQGRV